MWWREAPSSRQLGGREGGWGVDVVPGRAPQDPLPPAGLHLLRFPPLPAVHSARNPSIEQSTPEARALSNC